MNQGMNVVGYVRVSTDEQASEGVSLEAQVTKLKSYCDLYGLNLVAVKSDPGLSAKSLDRPGLQAALRMLSDGHAKGIVVAKLDRLTRSVADLSTLLSNYFSEAANHHLFLVADQVDTRTAGGRLVLNVLTVISQWERETIVERTRTAIDHKRSKGEVLGTIPYGFDRDPADPSKLKPNMLEQRWISIIHDLHDNKLSSTRWIAKHLNECQVATKQPGTRWHHSTIAQILRRKGNLPTWQPGMATGHLLPPG